MTGDFHSDTLGHSRINHASNGSPPEVMPEASGRRESEEARAPRLAAVTMRATAKHENASACSDLGKENTAMSTITTNDGTQIYYKDWGSGQPVVFSHGWPLSADAWEDQMLFLGGRGYRVIAHDRRGHGRSSQPWNGNDMDTYADDVAALVEALALNNAIHVGHSTGGGEVARYIGRHGTKRVSKAVLIAAIPPLMLKTAANPAGLPMEVFDGIRAGVLADRSQFFKDLTTPFYGANRPGAKVSQGLRDSFWLQGMQAGFKNVFDCIKAFSETDHTDDLRKLNVPTLIIHGDDDQIVPIGASAQAAVKIAPKAQLKVYPGAPHGLCSTHKDQVNADLLAFLKA
jgi:non-heme chloroperoxidase